MKYTAKYTVGAQVIINQNVVGVIIASHNMYMETHKPCFIYRVIVDAHELVYRSINNNVDQTKDQHLFKEDFDNLYYSQISMGYVDIDEEKIELYDEDAIFQNMMERDMQHYGIPSEEELMQENVPQNASIEEKTDNGTEL